MSIEEFLQSLPAIRIVGGSPLYTGLPEFAISINGKRDGAYAAAINNRPQDARRVRGWERVMMPNPLSPQPATVMVPAAQYKSPAGLEKFPTTCFSLLLICQCLSLRAELFGVCGWASKWHDGDWEMHYVKTRMPTVTVHDPRPRW